MSKLESSENDVLLKSVRRMVFQTTFFSDESTNQLLKTDVKILYSKVLIICDYERFESTFQKSED